MEVQIIISLFSLLLGAFIGVLTYTRKRDKDVKDDASELAIIKTKLDSIGSGIESIRVDMKANEARVAHLSERLVRLEESSRQAHKRIECLEKTEEYEE